MTGMRTHRFMTVDALRGLGALTVMAFHNDYLRSFCPHGCLAVDLFFVLSGLVLAEAYGERLAARLSVGGFMAIRFIRLYPFYAISTLLGLLAGVLASRFGAHNPDWNPGDLAGSLAFSALLLPTPPLLGFISLYPLLIAAWSLAYELLVNLAWALLRPKVRAAGLALVVAAAACGMLYLVLARSVSVNTDSVWSRDSVGMASCRILYSFGMGLFISRFRRGFPFGVNPWIPLGLALAVLTADPARFGSGFDLCAVLVVLPMVVLLASNSEPLYRWESRGFAFFGDASYGIYMLHLPVVALCYRLLAPLGPTPGFWFAVATMGLVVLLADGLGRAYDLPVRRWLAGRSKAMFALP